MDRLKALLLLDQCDGDEIWSLETCREKGVPEEWIKELSDCFESGFDDDRMTIYIGDRVTNQYLGVRAVDLARELGLELGLPMAQIVTRAGSRRELVRAIQEAAEEC
jgi:hypothetical protein